MRFAAEISYMGVGVGIVGLPNVGKSTLFNALTRQSAAEAANYPFCTIEPNKAIVPVPDPRLDKLTAIVGPRKTICATVDFVDIAGLVKGASKGEGLGNQFLGNIRETQAILHVVRCFDDDDVIHVDGSIDPIRDIEVIELELIIADSQQIEKKLDTLAKRARSDKAMKPAYDIAEALKKHLDSGMPAFNFEDKDKDAAIGLYNEMRFLTAKPVIYCANVDESGMLEDNGYVKKVRAYAEERGSDIIKICAKMEEDMIGLEDEERSEFLKEYGVEESGLDKVIHTGYHTLGLISYFTAGEKEVRAWTIHRGWKAPQAASVIHTDFEKGFIRAEVIGFNDFINNNGEQGAKAAGQMRVEGKEYVVENGDVMHFRFNV